MIERAPPANRSVVLPRAEGCFIQRADRARFVWINQPAAAAALGIGLVIVPPFGYEAICAHRSLRHLAEAGARAGMVAVRVDLDGTGDSVGGDLDGGRLDAWKASIGDACDLARQRGADRIVLAGVRLGATLAMLAAGKRDDIAGVVAIAPVASGKALVREARALQMQLGLASAPAGREGPEDLHEVTGFAMSAETRAALSQIDLLKLARAPAPAVLLLDRDDLAGNDKLAAALRACGATVEHHKVSGYVEMVLDPHHAVVPRSIVDAAIRFAIASPPLISAMPSEITTTRTATIGHVTEEVIALDDHMTAIASRAATPPGRAVILINAGATYRIGPNRLHVELARSLAARGDLVLRVDLSGLGDSRARTGSAENLVYSPHAVTDVGVAVAWTKHQGARTIAVVGLCSGAYHAQKAAVDGQLIDTIVPINPLTFFYKPGMPLDFAAFRVTSETVRYQKSLKSIASWLKLLRGNVNIVRVARIITERARSAAEHRARDVARQLRVPLRDDLGSELLALGRHGVAMRFIFAGDDPGHEMLVEQAGSALGRLVKAGKLTIDRIGGADHTFTPRWSHAVLIETITRALS